MSETKSYKASKLISLLLCLISYIVAVGVAIGIGITLNQLLHPIMIAFIADLIATMIIYFLSVYFKNTSLYDPYWSVIPIIIVLYWLFTADNFPVINIRQIIILTIVIIWGVRLTYNWVKGWKGLVHEDWRYTKYREDQPRLFWFINLTGLQMMPTLLVFLGCVPLYFGITYTEPTLTVFDIIGVAIAVAAITIETLADEQLRNFVKTKQEHEFMTTGIWSVTRHPNYFGEVSFWWGLFFFSLTAGIVNIWTIAGPISITILFLIVSIPLMENRLLKKYPDYQQYKSKVSRLVPWFHKKQ